MTNLANRANLKYILEKHGFTFKKSLGQNFLIDSNILDKIVNKAGIDKQTGVIEIGPGIGALTQHLAKNAGKVVAVEIDKRLIPILDDTLSDYENVKIINKDVLKTSIKDIIADELTDYSKIKVVANLPYYVTSPIIIKLLQEGTNIDSITVMLQKEVAERISAKPGGKDYGSLTLLIEYYADANILFNVPNTVFVPRPNVDSTIIQLKLHEEPPIVVNDEEFLFRVIRASFAQRRKTLYNNLINNLLGKESKESLDEILVDLSIDPKRRAETLNIKEFGDLSNSLKNLVKPK